MALSPLPNNLARLVDINRIVTTDSLYRGDSVPRGSTPFSSVSPVTMEVTRDVARYAQRISMSCVVNGNTLTNSVHLPMDIPLDGGAMSRAVEEVKYNLGLAIVNQLFVGNVTSSNSIDGHLESRPLAPRNAEVRVEKPVKVTVSPPTTEADDEIEL